MAALATAWMEGLCLERFRGRALGHIARQGFACIDVWHVRTGFVVV